MSPSRCGHFTAVLTMFAVAVIAGCSEMLETPLPDGYWTESEADEILDQTIELRLDVDLSGLSESERAAVKKLIAAGVILQRLYEDSLHNQALSSYEDLQILHAQLGQPDQTEKLIRLYRLFNGPVATTLENERLTFLPVMNELPGRNVFPVDATREEIEQFVAAHPEAKNSLLGLRSLVRRATPENLDRDLSVLARHPTLATLHPLFREHTQMLAASDNRNTFYSVPYSIAWSEELFAVFDLLLAASELMTADDPDFAAYLRLRARDLLVDDYESGDAAWTRGSFKNLNAEIGSYETYDDKLFGVKSFFALSVLVRDKEKTEQLLRANIDLQELEDSLPITSHKRVTSDIPIGIYNVVADFGQARGTNTASILPNDPEHTRKYGRTVLVRFNIMSHPDLFANQLARYRAAVADKYENDLTRYGAFERTVWHEIGHYLGPGVTADGRDLDVALAEYSDLLEEMKSDLISLYSAQMLADNGYHGPEELKSIYADGIRRVVQHVRPRRTQPYQTMQLMQMNFFLENGLLQFDPGAGELVIRYDRYHEVVRDLLTRVLELQFAGNRAAAADFVEQYGEWREDLHDVLAAGVRESVLFRYALVRYGAMGE